jgi:hypothetical protein
MFHKDAPDYLNSLVPPQISETHQHNTRISNNTFYLNCRTFYYQNSFLPSSMKLWNNISNDIRLNSSKCCFKRFLDRNVCTKSYYFNFGSRIIFARLRLKCSSLKYPFVKKILLIQACVHVEK